MLPGLNPQQRIRGFLPNTKKETTQKFIPFVRNFFLALSIKRQRQRKRKRKRETEGKTERERNNDIIMNL